MESACTKVGMLQQYQHNGPHVNQQSKLFNSMNAKSKFNKQPSEVKSIQPNKNNKNNSLCISW